MSVVLSWPVGSFTPSPRETFERGWVAGFHSSRWATAVTSPSPRELAMLRPTTSRLASRMGLERSAINSGTPTATLVCGLKL